MQKKYTQHVAKGIIALSIIALPLATFAENTPNQQTNTHTMPSGEKMHGRKGEKGITGTVTAIAGNVVTITNAAGATYTIDATSAKFPTQPTAQTLATIIVGDKISSVGTLSGTTVVATRITDMSSFERTVFSGRITAISGSMITITDMKKVVKTVDATSATIVKGGRTVTTETISDLKVGNRIMAIGTVSGTAITATKIIDSGAPHMMGGFMKKMMKKN
jgi:hypothetical protein